jgi:hypothetical protein
MPTIGTDTMRHAHPQQYLASEHLAVAFSELRDMREMRDIHDRPSLAESLADMLAAAAESAPRRGAPWDITMPAGLEALRPSGPFEEPLRGLVMREVIEPDVFRHFFGR